MNMEETGGGGKKSLDLYIFVICSQHLYKQMGIRYERKKKLVALGDRQLEGISVLRSGD